MDNGFFKEVPGPNGNKIVIDLENLSIDHENRNLTNFFLESCKKVRERTALKWLETVDDATIIMIGQCGNYTVMDVQPFIKTKYSDQIIDFTLLTLFMMKWEGTLKYADVADLGKATLNMYYLTMSEAMARKGLMEIMGSGMITKTDTKINLTEKGKSFSKSIGSKFFPKNEFLLPPDIINGKDDKGFPTHMSYESLVGDQRQYEKREVGQIPHSEMHVLSTEKDTTPELSVESMIQFNKSPIKEIQKNTEEVKRLSEKLSKKLKRIDELNDKVTKSLEKPKKAKKTRKASKKPVKKPRKK